MALKTVDNDTRDPTSVLILFEIDRVDRILRLIDKGQFSLSLTQSDNGLSHTVDQTVSLNAEFEFQLISQKRGNYRDRARPMSRRINAVFTNPIVYVC